MNLEGFEYITLFEEDNNGRKIYIFNINDVSITGHNCHYPNAMLHNKGKIYNPLDETIMSLKNVKKQNPTYKIKTPTNVIKDPVFYFIYNVDNYYHFIYDTLPYLISYLKLRESIPNLKLLTNYPNGHSMLYKFVIEFLNLLSIQESDILIVNDITSYDTMYVSSSYTHGHNSNKPPRKEIYNFYKHIISLVPKNFNTPKKIYVSRRTWVHNDLSNIGTNYTTRRKMINEDILVNKLTSLGYIEVFPESMSIIEKIQLFSNAKEIIGPIGGGLVNVLFSNPDCKLFVLVSPTFLDINKRFKYSFSNLNTTYFTECTHESNEEYKLYMRVQSDNIIGEISNINNNNIVIEYIDYPVAGWNNTLKYKNIIIDKSKCIKLDNGLNSPWVVDIEKLLNIL
jgi:hypothetical protein